MTENGHLRAAINDALAIPDWDDSILGVKRVMINALRRMDQRVQIHNTGYFNHSFVPDFTLTWDSEEDERHVYLRLDSSPSFLENDLRYLGTEEPILVGLSPEPADSGIREVDKGASGANVLVTDSDALDRFGSQPTAEFSSIVPAAVLRGGRGVVQQPDASALVSAGVKFFGGARAHKSKVLSDSATLIRDHLNPSESDAVVNFGRIVWEATGGHPNAFPLPTNLAGLDNDAIRFLMEEGPGQDISYWRSIGQTISLDRLLMLGVYRPKNLWNLLAANLDRIVAKFLIVRRNEPSLEDSTYWAVVRGAVEFRGEEFSALFASRREDVLPDLLDAGRKPGGISLNQLRERTENMTVESVTVSTSDRKTVTVTSKSVLDVGGDKTLAGLGGATVERVGIRVGGKHLECRFDQLDASGHTNAVFELREFLEFALPVLWRLGETDRNEIKRLLATWQQAKASEELFDVGSFD